MSRPPLPIGSWGSISTKVTKTDKNGKPITHQSQAKFRDHDGHVRNVTATGRTKTAAEQAVLKNSKIAPRRTSPASSPPCTRSTTS